MTSPGIGVDMFAVDMSDVDRMFRLMESRLDDSALAVFLKNEMEPYLQQRAAQRFASEGDDATGTWLPLSPATESMRISQGFAGPHPINKRTGELERYITQSAGNINSAPGGIELVYPGTDPTGALFDKTSTAQKGKPNPKTNPRPVLAVGATDMNHFMTELAFYIQNG